MLRSPWRQFGAVLCLCGGCFSERFDGSTPLETTGTSAGTSADTSGMCVPGTETCACIEGGKCDPGLVCASQLCVDLGGLTSPHPGDGSGDAGDTGKTTDDGGASSDGTGSGETGPIGEPGSCVDHCGEQVPHFQGTCFCDPPCAASGDCCDDYTMACVGECLFNGDCADDQVCSVASMACIDAFAATYDIVVDTWQDNTPICWDGLGDCYADVYYQIFYGGDVVFTSDVVDDTVMATWTIPWSSPLDPATVLTFAFTDHDTVLDEAIETDCFVDGDGACAAVPASVLHEGNMQWDPGGDSFAVQVRFSAQ